MVADVAPLVVPPVLVSAGRRWLPRIAVEPPCDVVAVVLAAPDHPGVALAMDAACLVVVALGLVHGMELVAFRPPSIDHVVEVAEVDGALRVAHADADHRLAPRLDRPDVVQPDLRAGLPGRHRIGPAIDDGVVDRVLGVIGGRFGAEDAREVGLVLAEEARRRAVALEAIVPELGVRGEDGAVVRVEVHPRARRVVVRPRPGVAEPGLRDDVDRRRLGAGIDDADPHQDVLGRGLRVLHVHVEPAVLVEDAGVDELVLRLVDAAAGVGLQQVLVREGGLRVPVEHPEVRAGRRGVLVPVRLLHVLAVVPLRIGEAEEPFLEDRVVPVPQGHREAESSLPIAEARESVLAPSIRPAPGMVVRERIPRRSVGRVVLSNRAPLAFAEPRSPLSPGAMGAVGSSDASAFLVAERECVGIGLRHGPQRSRRLTRTPIPRAGPVEPARSPRGVRPRSTPARGSRPPGGGRRRRGPPRRRGVLVARPPA